MATGEVKITGELMATGQAKLQIYKVFRQHVITGLSLHGTAVLFAGHLAHSAASLLCLFVI